MEDSVVLRYYLLEPKSARTLERMIRVAKKVQVEHKGKRYQGIKKDRRVNVKLEKTARGMHLFVGTFNIDSQTWNEKEKIPDKVKESIEKKFAQ